MDLKSILDKLNSISEAKEETPTGTIHRAGPGGYGRKFDTDEEGEETGASDTTIKRGRGRPKKGADATGHVPSSKVAPNMPSWLLPTKPPKLSPTTKQQKQAITKHTLKDWFEHLDKELTEALLPGQIPIPVVDKQGDTQSTAAGFLNIDDTGPAGQAINKALSDLAKQKKVQIVAPTTPAAGAAPGQAKPGQPVAPGGAVQPAAAIQKEGEMDVAESNYTNTNLNAILSRVRDPNTLGSLQRQADWLEKNISLKNGARFNAQKELAWAINTALEGKDFSSALNNINQIIATSFERTGAPDGLEKDLTSYIKRELEKLKPAQKVAEGSGQNLSVQQLATISDEALDKAYGYGRSTPGNTFGWQANLMSAAYAKKMIDAGVTDIEAISDAIHKGWNVTAQKFVQNPDQFDDTEKLRQAGKLDAKLQQRAKLMKINYAQLDNEEQEKDRVVARALLQALKGQQGLAEQGELNEISSALAKRAAAKAYSRANDQAETGTAAAARAYRAQGDRLSAAASDRRTREILSPAKYNRLKQQEQGVEEVITKKTPAGKIIKDFQKSKDPKFKDKSKEERKRMALGAYYGMHPEKSTEKDAKKSVKEADIPSSNGVDTRGAGLGSGRSDKALETKKVATMKKTVKENSENRLKAAHARGRSHALAKEAYSCHYDDVEEARMYLEGYKEGLEECYGVKSSPVVDERAADTTFGTHRQIEPIEPMWKKPEPAQPTQPAQQSASGREDREELDFTKEDEIEENSTATVPGMASQAQKSAAAEYSANMHEIIKNATPQELWKIAYEFGGNPQNARYELELLKKAQAELKGLSKDDLDEMTKGAWMKHKAKVTPGGSFQAFGQTMHDKDVLEDEFAFESLDKQLNDLLSEGLNVSVSQGQQGQPNSVSVSATDAEADKLLSFVKQAGLGMFGNADKSDYGTPSDSSGVDKHGEIEVVGDHDGMMSLIKKVSGAPEKEVDYKDEVSSDDASCKVCGAETCQCEENVVAKDSSDDASCKVCGETTCHCEENKAVVVGEEESSDQMTYKVAETKDNEGVKLDEWANDAGKKGTDAAFQLDIEFMTKAIAGGLNKPKRDQTTLPHTAVKVVPDESPIEDWRKLAGIK